MRLICAWTPDRNLSIIITSILVGWSESPTKQRPVNHLLCSFFSLYDRWRCEHSSQSGRPTAEWCDRTSQWPHSWSWGGSESRWRQLDGRKISAEAGSGLWPTDCQRQSRRMRLKMCFKGRQTVQRCPVLTEPPGRVHRRQNNIRAARTACPTQGSCGPCSQRGK